MYRIKITPEIKAKFVTYVMATLSSIKESDITQVGESILVVDFEHRKVPVLFVDVDNIEEWDDEDEYSYTTLNSKHGMITDGVDEIFGFNEGGISLLLNTIIENEVDIDEDLDESESNGIFCGDPQFYIEEQMKCKQVTVSESSKSYLLYITLSVLAILFISLIITWMVVGRKIV